LIAKGTQMIGEQALNFTRSLIREEAPITTASAQSDNTGRNQDEDVLLQANQDATATTKTTTTTAPVAATATAKATAAHGKHAQTYEEEDKDLEEVTLTTAVEEKEGTASIDLLDRFFDDSFPTLQSAPSQTSSKRSKCSKRKDAYDDMQESSARWVKKTLTEEGKPRRRHRSIMLEQRKLEGETPFS
jgi:hypothetical protein